MEPNVDIYIEMIDENAVLPVYAHDGDAGMDLYSTSDIYIKPGETVLIHTGLKMAIPEGYEVQIRPRSGVSLNTPLRIPNAPGTIDSGYRGELCVIINNISPKETEANIFDMSSKGNNLGTYHIKKGDRVAQMVISSYNKGCMKLCDDVSAIGQDRQGGFGSTGV